PHWPAPHRHLPPFPTRRSFDLVGLVINYELPDTAEALTHRVGRTARNGNTGRALTFITSDDHEKWGKLRRQGAPALRPVDASALDRKSTRLNSSHDQMSYGVFC